MDDAVNLASFERGEDAFDVGLVRDLSLHEFELQDRSGLPVLSQIPRCRGIPEVEKHEHAAESGNHLFE